MDINFIVCSDFILEVALNAKKARNESLIRNEEDYNKAQQKRREKEEENKLNKNQTKDIYLKTLFFSYES